MHVSLTAYDRFEGKAVPKAKKRVPTMTDIIQAAGMDEEELNHLGTDCGPSPDLYDSYKISLLVHGVLQWRIREPECSCVIMNDMDMTNRCFEVPFYTAFTFP